MDKRDSRVMVRLAPGKLTPPDEVRFTALEKKAVDQGAVDRGFLLSTFIRAVGVASARATVAWPDLDDYQTVKTAAESCNLPLGEWLRLVALTAVAFSPLVIHLEASRGFSQTAVAP